MSSYVRQACEIWWSSHKPFSGNSTWSHLRWYFWQFSRCSFRPEVVSDVTSGTNVGQIGMDVPVKFGDSSSNSSGDIWAAAFVVVKWHSTDPVVTGRMPYGVLPCNVVFCLQGEYIAACSVKLAEKTTNLKISCRSWFVWSCLLSAMIGWPKRSILNSFSMKIHLVILVADGFE